MSTARCAFCLWQLTENDDAVACPECSTPYHRDCYAENGGCSTFGCAAWIQTQGPEAVPATSERVPMPVTYGTEREPFPAVWDNGPAHAPATGPFCTSCGARGESSDRFCTYCGAALVNPEGA